MTHWTAYFDKVFLINLPERTDRLKEATDELGRYNIQFERFEATSDQNGAYGLYKTMMALFKMCVEIEYYNILVFEDDIKFLLDVKETNKIMNDAFKQMDIIWDLLYLGINHPIPFGNKISKNILRVERGLSTHAVGYNIVTIKHLLNAPMILPFDIMLVEKIQKFNLSICINPILCTQRPGYSNIENKYVSHYSTFLEDRFAEQTKHLI